MQSKSAARQDRLQSGRYVRQLSDKDFKSYGVLIYKLQAHDYFMYLGAGRVLVHT